MGTLPPGTLLLIRHARAAGQEPEAPLTADGEAQARTLAKVLAPLRPTRLVSSPWRRAVDTIKPLSVTLGLSIKTDDRLTERVLSGRDLPYWRTALKLSFAVPGLRLPGGESGKKAGERVAQALADAREATGLSMVVTHGNLLALALGLDFDGWAGLRNPDVWVWEPGQAAWRLEIL